MIQKSQQMGLEQAWEVKAEAKAKVNVEAKAEVNVEVNAEAKEEESADHSGYMSLFTQEDRVVVRTYNLD